VKLSLGVFVCYNISAAGQEYEICFTLCRHDVFKYIECQLIG